MIKYRLAFGHIYQHLLEASTKFSHQSKAVPPKVALPLTLAICALLGFYKSYKEDKESDDKIASIIFEK